MARTVVVTGASRGIGKATVERFLRKGDRIKALITMARASSDYTQAIMEFGERKGQTTRLIPLEVDVGDREALRAAIAYIHSEVGNIDILINNAGYTNPVPIHQVEFSDFERTMAVNVYAPFTLVQDLLHHGNRFELIVNIASTAGITGRAGWVTYSASKAAVINMSQVMREELAIYGTRVASISPGRTATALRRILAPNEDPATIMQAEDVSEVIDMLASPVGRFIDSENIVVRQ